MKIKAIQNFLVFASILLIIGTQDVSYGSYTMPSDTDIFSTGRNNDASKVKWIQAALNYCKKYKGLSFDSYLTVDGDYGTLSKRAVIEFQRKYGLTKDGEFGPDSISQMKTVLGLVQICEVSYSKYTMPSNSDILSTSRNNNSGKVKWVQAALNYCKKNKSLSISSCLEVDGSYGQGTKSAVIAFQKKYSLSQDGDFGPNSIIKMKSLLGIEQTCDVAYSKYTMPSNSDKLSSSKNNEAGKVKWVQAALNYCKKNKSLSISSCLDIDGEYGTLVRSAVIAFQKKYGLSQDGDFGPNSISKMKSVLGIITQSCDTSYSSYTQPSNIDTFSTTTSNNSAKVKWIQAALNYCKEYKSLTFSSCLTVDGSYGPLVKNAVLKFQEKYDLSPDGIFGPKSITKMKSELGIEVNEGSHKVSKNGINLIKEFEGFSSKAYYDSAGGVWTIGYGTTDADEEIIGTKITKGMTISQSTAESWLQKTLDTKYADCVNKYDYIYSWNQNEFDALISFCYNIGNIKDLTKSGTRSREEISEKMLLYNKAGGEVLPGLTRRRKKEQELFLK